MFGRAVLACLTLICVAAAPLTIRLELDSPSGPPTWFALGGPDRIVVDLPGGRAAARTVAASGVVARVRLAQFERSIARVVIDLAEPARLERADVDGRNVTLTLASTSAADFARLARGGHFAAVPPAPAATATAARVKVVIDPGHGGRDVGAVSAWEGRYEKDATLAIARAIRRELIQAGFDASLTRDSDRFIDLGGRVAIARERGAALFISVHADSAGNAAARGATVYTLSEVASDAMAARLAARENRSDALAGVDLGGEDPEVATILYDLAKRRATNASAAFAGTLARALAPDVPTRGDFHRFAGFRVLKTVDMPAVLLETGYLSNAHDARFLFSEAGQRAIARGVRRAVEAQFAPRLAQSAPR